MTEKESLKAKDISIYPTIAEPKALRDVVENDIYLLGGQVAILCQFAHPALAKGSYKHSSFAERIPQRLRNTARFLNVAVCGTEEEKKAIFSVIHRYHSRVKGDDYTADDPELHKWTAATLFVSIIFVRETFFGRMDRAEMENLLRESAVFGTSLRMPPEMWPKTLEEFWEYWDYNIATLEVTDMARSLAKDLLYPRNLPMGMAWTLPLARILTVNWLPERLRREYNLYPTLASQAAYLAIVAWTRTVYPVLPVALRGRRHQIYMEDLKKAVERINQTGHWGGV
ncbi:oxygenase MpaB family protein [Aspergillus lucknowensis]|uniref:ER-bound oxygenase mpaB/mpaB'/Rubber oxygenase catalytic domain-containing protein n=1 Tax=Aspergillus lucknowensis TaxID=176173 RepID=A0ABR4LE64_9EURO